MWGVTKAYSTRVGAGPFPTELEDAQADEIRERGGEYGTTTGRPRRVGWLDLVALRYAARLNSLTALAVTKLDVLSGLDRVGVCTRYAAPEGAELDHFPYHQSVLHHAIGKYAELPGWREDLSECRSGVRPARRGARLPAVHRRLRQGPDRADRRRAGPRRGDLDRGRQRDDARRRRSGAGRGARRSQRLAPALEQVLVGDLADRAGRDAHHDRPGRTSLVTSAPAATNASSPISTPGMSTTPPPTRHARRKTAHRARRERGGPSCCRSSS